MALFKVLGVIVQYLTSMLMKFPTSMLMELHLHLHQDEGRRGVLPPAHLGRGVLPRCHRLPGVPPGTNSSRDSGPHSSSNNQGSTVPLPRAAMQLPMCQASPLRRPAGNLTCPIMSNHLTSPVRHLTHQAISPQVL